MTWLGEHLTAVLQSLGALANLAGVLLLFRFGMPFRLRGKRSYLVVGEQTVQDRRTDTRYGSWGYLGIVLVVLGTGALIAASWTSPLVQTAPSNTPPDAAEALRVSWLSFYASLSQAVVAVLVGAGVIWVAVVQIDRFVKAETTKATLQYLAAFSEVIHQVPNNPNMSVATALSLASGMAKSPADLAYYKTCIPDGKRNVLPHNDQVGFDRYSTAFTITSNYFSTGAEYIRQGILDGGMFVNARNRQILLAKSALEAVQDAEPLLAQVLSVPSFQLLVKAVGG